MEYMQRLTPYIAKLAYHPVVHLVGIVLTLAGQTDSAMTLDVFLPTSGDRPSYWAMVDRRDGPSWLCDDDDDDLSSASHPSWPVLGR